MRPLKLALATFSVITSLCGIVSTAVAQSTTAPLSQQSLQEFQQNNSQSTYSVGGSGGLNILQLIHNSNLTGGKSSDEIRSGQQESLDEATKEFRLRQLQKLNVNNPALVTTPAKLQK
jgi:hypothetical protein